MYVCIYIYMCIYIYTYMHLGFQRSIASLFQQAGRAGRRQVFFFTVVSVRSFIYSKYM